MTEVSAWRANDVVEYDAMREFATMLTALLLRKSSDDPSSALAASAEVRVLRQDVLGVDAYDRAAVSSLATRIGSRIIELRESGT